MGEFEPDEEIADAITHAIIGKLLTRGGFDHWWYEIDEDIQWELRQAIMDTVRKTLNEETKAFTATSGDSVKGWIA